MRVHIRVYTQYTHTHTHKNAHSHKYNICVYIYISVCMPCRDNGHKHLYLHLYLHLYTGGAQQVSARFVNSRVIVARWLSEPNGKIINAEVAYGVCVEYFLPSGKKYLTGDWMAAPKDDATMKLTWRSTFERTCSEEPRSKVCVRETSSSPGPTLDQVQKMILDTNSGFQTQRKKERKKATSNGYVFF